MNTVVKVWGGGGDLDEKCSGTVFMLNGLKKFYKLKMVPIWG